MGQVVLCIIFQKKVAKIALFRLFLILEGKGGCGGTWGDRAKALATSDFS